MSIIRFALCLFCIFAVFRSEDADAVALIVDKSSKVKAERGTTEVVVVRDEHRTVLTVVPTYKGDSRELAVVVPVFAKIDQNQLNVGDARVLQKLASVSALRLVEQSDLDPCQASKEFLRRSEGTPGSAQTQQASGTKTSSASGTKGFEVFGAAHDGKEAVGEVDLTFLPSDSKESIVRWLAKAGYKLSGAATKSLHSMGKKKPTFVIGQVKLPAEQKQGFVRITPLQIAFEAKDLTIPLRFSTTNLHDVQDIVVYGLARGGRLKTTGPEPVKRPSGLELPRAIKNNLSALHAQMVKHADASVRPTSSHLEYAWDLGWCDPCVGDPLNYGDLKSLGVFWVKSGEGGDAALWQGTEVFLTRLHVRYDPKTAPEALGLSETGDKNFFQMRFLSRIPFTGKASCDAALAYQAEAEEREASQAKSLASLTGMDEAEVRRRMKLKSNGSWIDELWK